MLNNKNGQTILEYSVLLGIVVVVMITMSPLVKRAIQSMVKLTADQIGNQVNSEQITDEETGFLEFSSAKVESVSNRQINEVFGDITYNFQEETKTKEESLSNLGSQVNE